MAQTSFTSFDSYTVAEVEVNPNDTQACEDLASSRLILPLRLLLRTGGDVTRGDLLFDSFTGDLWTDNGRYVATASPVRMCSFRKAEWKDPDTVLASLEFVLTPRHIEAIEQVRKGNVSLRLSLWLRVTSFGDGARGGFQLQKSHAVTADLSFTVPESIWRDRILSGLGYGRVRIVELPVISNTVWPGMEHAFTALEKAERNFRAGFYDDTAAACRVALDKFFDMVDKPDKTGKMPVLKRSWELRLGEATSAWLNGSLSAIKGAANAVHHDAAPRFDRFEAQMFLMITITVVSYVARRLDASPDPTPREPREVA